uniref:Uncharacterized protein n=1 Tax=Prolemur simus TaxID=1328070 RepID=A0A8C9DJA6_PROSS
MHPPWTLLGELWPSLGTVLAVNSGYGSTYSPAGYDFGYGYTSFWQPDYRKYWAFDLY